MRKDTNLPDGYGVFRTPDWLDCGRVKDGGFTDGKKVSLHAKACVLKLINAKTQPDGTVY